MKRMLPAMLVLLACGPAVRPGGDRVRVVTTIGVLADWARQVGGDRIDVTALLSGNESPHTYEATPQDAQALARGDVLIRVGLGLDDWLEPVIENAGNAKLIVVTAADDVAGIVAGDEPGHAAGNPHVWLDPECAKLTAAAIARALAARDPKGESAYAAGAARFTVRLDSLSAAIAAAAGGLADRRFISFHDAWPYFARRFGFEVVATVEPIPGQEPSGRQLATLVDLVRLERVRVVTTEPQLPSALPQMLARETGVRVLVLDPLLAGPDGTVDYVAGLGAVADSLARALR
jgi:ABC-type Zn uptake system ZnuABC Zn-binding protein ZnuA